MKTFGLQKLRYFQWFGFQNTAPSPGQPFDPRLELFLCGDTTYIVSSLIVRITLEEQRKND